MLDILAYNYEVDKAWRVLDLMPGINRNHKANAILLCHNYFQAGIPNDDATGYLALP